MPENLGTLLCLFPCCWLAGLAVVGTIGTVLDYVEWRKSQLL